MSIWKKARNNIPARLLVLLVTAPVGVVMTIALRRWGILDPIGEALGRWLGNHVSPETTAWIIGIILTLLLWIAALILIAWLPLRLGKRNSMRFVFPNEAGNMDSKITDFRVSRKILPAGQPIKTPLTRQIFYVGIENLTDKTLRNVRLVIQSTTPLLYSADIHCFSKRTSSSSIDIQPGATELFIFGEGYDTSDGTGIEIRQPVEIDILARRAANTPFHLGAFTDNPHPLPKNDGYIILLSAYADDTPPITTEAMLNTRARIELRLKDGPAVFSPA